MDFDRNFTMTLDDGRVVTADIIINFEYMDNKYCIYSMNLGDDIGVYCAKNIDGQLIRVTNSEEQDFVNTVANNSGNTEQEQLLEQLYEDLKSQNEELYSNKQENLVDPFSYEQPSIDLNKYGITKMQEKVQSSFQTTNDSENNTSEEQNGTSENTDENTDNSEENSNEENLENINVEATENQENNTESNE